MTLGPLIGLNETTERLWEDTPYTVVVTRIWASPACWLALWPVQGFPGSNPRRSSGFYDHFSPHKAFP